jgi:hypothetical protein
MSAAPILYHEENGWQQNPGYRPCEPNTLCDMVFRGGARSKGPYKAGNFVWQLRGWDFDIVQYRIVGAGE